MFQVGYGFTLFYYPYDILAKESVNTQFNYQKYSRFLRVQGLPGGGPRCRCLGGREGGQVAAHDVADAHGEPRRLAEERRPRHAAGGRAEEAARGDGVGP